MRTTTKRLFFSVTVLATLICTSCNETPKGAITKTHPAKQLTDQLLLIETNYLGDTLSISKVSLIENTNDTATWNLQDISEDTYPTKETGTAFILFNRDGTRFEVIDRLKSGIQVELKVLPATASTEDRLLHEPYWKGKSDSLSYTETIAKRRLPRI